MSTSLLRRVPPFESKLLPAVLLLLKIYFPRISACAPLCCKNMCCASRFCTGGVGAAGSRSKQCPRARKRQNASPEEQPEAPRPRWKLGQQQNPGPENQDSQHMLEQPRWSFPENYHYRYRLEIRMNYHYRCRLGARSHPFISMDSQLPSRKPFELISSKLPSDTKLLLTKNYSEIIIFEKLRISRVISGQSLSFPEILRVQFPSKITKNNSQGIIFVIISCQRVPLPLPS